MWCCCSVLPQDDGKCGLEKRLMIPSNINHHSHWDSPSSFSIFPMQHDPGSWAWLWSALALLHWGAPLKYTILWISHIPTWNIEWLLGQAYLRSYHMDFLFTVGEYSPDSIWEALQQGFGSGVFWWCKATHWSHWFHVTIESQWLWWSASNIHNLRTHMTLMGSWQGLNGRLPSHSKACLIPRELMMSCSSSCPNIDLRD